MKQRYRVNLAAAQAECEANYARLRGLLPEMEDGVERVFGLPRGGHLCLTVTERAPYTATLDIRHLKAQEPWTGGAQFTVRVYDDARMAEVVACQGQRQFQPRYDYPNPAMHQRDEKAQLNVHLGEWLAYCLRHGFVLDDLVASAARC